MIKRIGKPSAPTTTQMGLYQQAFDYFNKKLWSDRLTPCMLVFSRRKARNHGHFCPKSWEGPTGKTHEIALNAAILTAPGQGRHPGRAGERGRAAVCPVR